MLLTVAYEKGDAPLNTISDFCKDMFLLHYRYTITQKVFFRQAEARGVDRCIITHIITSTHLVIASVENYYFFFLPVRISILV